MKSIKLTNGLAFNKSVLSKLQDTEMSSIKGRGTSGPRCTCNRNSCSGNEKETLSTN